MPQMTTEPLPLSYAQRRLWFLDQLDSDSTEYSLLEAHRLRGPLDVRALRRAVNAVVARHGALRTHFSEREGEPMQIVEPERVIPVPVVDLRGLPPGRRAAQERLVLRRLRAWPFDLARGPVLRAALLRLEAEESLSLRLVHHIAYDGWSRGILNRELAVLYAAFRSGGDSPLPPPAAQYADFAMWQRRTEDRRTPDDGLAYWTRQLEGLADRAELPADRPRPATHTAVAGVCCSTVSAERLEPFTRMSREHRATGYMALLAGVALLVRRYVNQDDITVGSPIAQRDDLPLQEAIGCFVNLIVLRVRMQSSMRLRDLLAEVRRTALDALSHRDVPFERVVEAVAPQRRLDRMPLFQILFTLQNVPATKAALTGLDVETVLADESRVGADLELYILERGGQLELVWQYNRALFDAWRIEQMARHYGRVLEAMAADAERPIDLVDWLDAEERRQLLYEWNATSRPLPETTLSGQFESAVDSFPDAVAVTCAGRALSYRELGGRADRLARLLRERGTRSEDIVAIAVPRSLEMIVALIAVLKTGAAYLPMDPEVPAPRLDFMLQDASPRCLVTTSAAARGLSDTTARVVLDEAATERALSTPAPSTAAITTSGRADRAPLPQHAAYVVYTSGSTGRAKGVVGTQRGLVNRLSWFAGWHDFRQAGPVLARSAFSFIDGSTELLGPLLRGGTIVLATAEEGRSLADLPSLAERHGVRLMTVVPSLLRALMEEAAARPLATCRTWITSGEALPSAHALSFREIWPAAELVNLYGASEATGDSLCRRNVGGDVTIGTPIWNTQAHVLDRRLALLPAGVEGELYLAGDGLARGYLGQPALTAARFLPNPYGAPGTRLYRTGDLARRRRDGSVEYLGRADDQVKVRGCRVEPGELQAALAGLDGVADAAVLARADARGETCLVGYVVPQQGCGLDPRAVREALRRRLPDYLVPSALVTVDRLPLTSHGKLDRAALQALDLPANEPGAPGTPEAERVCRLVAEVLGVERVASGDNFFDLGGHSLLAMRLANQLGAAFGVRLSVRAIFEAHTLGDLAEFLIGA